jgi:hypothetical protein
VSTKLRRVRDAMDLREGEQNQKPDRLAIRANLQTENKQLSRSIAGRKAWRLRMMAQGGVQPASMCSTLSWRSRRGSWP